MYKELIVKVKFNIGLPAMMAGIALAILGAGQIFFILATIGGLVTVVGIFFFGYNVLRNLGR